MQNRFMCCARPSKLSEYCTQRIRCAWRISTCGVWGPSRVILLFLWQIYFIVEASTEHLPGLCQDFEWVRVHLVPWWNGVKTCSMYSVTMWVPGLQFDIRFGMLPMVAFTWVGALYARLKAIWWVNVCTYLWCAIWGKKRVSALALTYLT